MASYRPFPQATESVPKCTALLVLLECKHAAHGMQMIAPMDDLKEIIVSFVCAQTIIFCLQTSHVSSFPPARRIVHLGTFWYLVQGKTMDRGAESCFLNSPGTELSIACLGAIYTRVLAPLRPNFPFFDLGEISSIRMR